jgi:hypothetical protein
MICLRFAASPPVLLPGTVPGESVKLVRALVAAAVALGTAVAIQMATTSDASALTPRHYMCGICWGVINE